MNLYEFIPEEMSEIRDVVKSWLHDYSPDGDKHLIKCMSEHGFDRDEILIPLALAKSRGKYGYSLKVQSLHHIVELASKDITLGKLIKDTEADVLIVGTDNIYHPEFVKDLNVYTVLQSTDDPNSSYMRTVPYIWAFDHVTCVNVRYHENMPARMTDKLIEWGAKRAIWRPYWVRESSYNPNLMEADVLNKKRNIDLLYVLNILVLLIDVMASDVLLQ